MNNQKLSAMADLAGIVIPTNPEDLKKIKSTLKQISDIMTMTEAHRDSISAELKNLVETYDLPAKFVRKMARAYHTQTFKKEIEEMSEFEALYIQVVGEE